MCRLFGLTAGRERTRATFWLLDAPDSMSRQSHANHDGAGVGTFDEGGAPVIDKQPLAAYDDADFARESRDLESSTFVAHVRMASSGDVTAENTHPFAMDGRILAHNGGFGDLARIEERVGADVMSLVRGDTDSERLFALITKETRERGDVAEGIVAALSWVADSLPVLSLNCIVTTPHELYAVRYPDTHELHLLERGRADERLEHRSEAGTRVVSEDLADAPCVVVASERLDDDPAWTAIEPGELVAVGADLRVTRRLVLPTPPARRMSS